IRADEQQQAGKQRAQLPGQQPGSAGQRGKTEHRHQHRDSARRENRRASIGLEQGIQPDGKLATVLAPGQRIAAGGGFAVINVNSFVNKGWKMPDRDQPCQPEGQQQQRADDQPGAHQRDRAATAKTSRSKNQRNGGTSKASTRSPASSGFSARFCGGLS